MSAPEPHGISDLAAGQYYGGVVRRARCGEALISEVVHGHSRKLPEHVHEAAYFSLLGAVATDGGRAAALAWRLYDQLRAGEGGGDLAMEGLCLELIAEVGRLGALYDHLRPPWLERLAGRLREEFDRPLSLVQLAGDEGVHPVRVARAFRRFYGQSVGEFRQARRVLFDSYKRRGRPLP